MQSNNSNNTDTKFCKDCRYSKKGRFDIEYRCYRPMNGVDAVTGTISYRFCKTIRGDDDKCSLKGKWYEPKQFAIQKVIQFFKKENK